MRGGLYLLQSNSQEGAPRKDSSIVLPRVGDGPILPNAGAGEGRVSHTHPIPFTVGGKGQVWEDIFPSPRHHVADGAGGTYSPSLMPSGSACLCPANRISSIMLSRRGVAFQSAPVGVG